MNRLVKKLYFVLAIALVCGNLSAQSLAEAKKMYDDGKYAEAKPAMEKLVKQSPANASYNLWYGVCCYETGDMAMAEKHLKVAVKRKVMEAYPYLADVYFKDYKFEDGVDMMDEYIALLEKKKLDTAKAQIQLDLISNAQRMMDKVEDIQIIDSVVIDKNNFLSAYTLSEESGSLKNFDQFFDSADPVFSTVFKNQKGDKIYYAHPTPDNNYCLFSESLLLDTWGDEKQLPMTINTNSDDNFPFVLSDGVTIYYSSKGHNSIGDYDLYVTRYNMNSDTYLAPEQLGMPFNSPYNDYMIVFDETKNLGWFVTDRFQPEDKVCVYLFIPNPDHSRVNTEDIEVKEARAKITSIKDTWKADANYSPLIALAHQEIPYGEKKIEKDFEFPLGNNTTYYTLSDIKSSEAKNIYQKVIGLNNQIRLINKQLENMRTNYIKASKTSREQMKENILAMEQQLNSLQAQMVQAEKQARNAEIKYLNK